ncbi:MAG: hypothetical protein Q9227_000390 [Pyrenula ochraceoflavens]
MAKPCLSLHVQITIDPKDVDAWFVEWRKVFPLVCAEPKCTFFEVYQSPENPGVISDASLEWIMETQLKKEYYKPYFEATEPMFIGPRKWEVYNRLGGDLTMVKSENITA